MGRERGHPFDSCCVGLFAPFADGVQENVLVNAFQDGTIVWLNISVLLPVAQ